MLWYYLVLESKRSDTESVDFTRMVWMCLRIWDVLDWEEKAENLSKNPFIIQYSFVLLLCSLYKYSFENFLEVFSLLPSKKF